VKNASLENGLLTSISSAKFPMAKKPAASRSRPARKVRKWSTARPRRPPRNAAASPHNRMRTPRETGAFLFWERGCNERRPHPEERGPLGRASRRMGQCRAAILRDASLRDAPQDEDYSSIQPLHLRHRRASAGSVARPVWPGRRWEPPRAGRLRIGRLRLHPRPIALPARAAVLRQAGLPSAPAPSGSQHAGSRAGGRGPPLTSLGGGQTPGRAIAHIPVEIIAHHIGRHENAGSARCAHRSPAARPSPPRSITAIV